MRDYLAFTYSCIDILRDDANREGVNLATDCLKQLKALNNQKRFPPRLLILLTSPEYLEPEKAEQMLAGIHKSFAAAGHKKVSLIGCTVAAVFCDKAVYPKGALLICLASHLMKAQVGKGENARQDPKGAVDELLDELELSSDGQVDPNPLATRLMLTFLPGLNDKGGQEFYPAPQLHRSLREGVKTRIRLVGGVCSVGDANRAQDGLLFAGRRAFKDAVVAANIDSGTPIGVSLSYGFEPASRVLRVSDVDEDRRTIRAFYKCAPAKLLEEEGKGILLFKLSTDGEPTIDLPRLADDGESLQLLRRVQPNDYFEVRKPDAAKILKEFKYGFDQAKKRILIKKPIACLTLAGRAWYNWFRPVFDVSNVLEFVKQEGIDCVGGFFDGEVGVDRTGRSLFMNGASSCLIFSDEMRERAPLYQGVAALAKFAPRLNDSLVDNVIDNALKMILKTGFPGAMLSLILPNQAGDHIIARGAIGKRFEKILEMTHRPCDSKDILAVVARKNKPKFIADSRKHHSCDKKAVAVGQLISQYVLPLRRLNDTVFGILQIDLGDLSHQTEDEFLKTARAKILNALAEIIGTGLSRISKNRENEIILQLDQALNRSLSIGVVEKGLQQFIESAGKALGVEMAHIRLATPEGTLAASSEEPVLTLVAGFGPGYEVGRKIRREVSAHDASLIYNAFRHGKVTIVNDANASNEYNALCRAAVGNAELTAALEQIKSYAAAVFRNEAGDRLGAFSLAFNEPWFFHRFHRRTIESLAQRLAFLIEHLRDRSRLEFLFKVSTKLAEIDLDEMPAELTDALKRFCEAINAEVASLFLWDEDRKKFILRAQHGWQEPDWVNAANYSMDDNWIGVKALEEKPLYIDDLNEYYKQYTDKSGGRYAKYIFGQALSDSYTVEAIGLALKIGKKQEKFGILTMYRAIKPGEGSGFLTTDAELLEEGAYKMAGLVNALLEHRNDAWQHQDQARHLEVYEAINPVEVKDSFESTTCKQVLKTYRAIEAVFYKADEPDSSTLSHVVGYCRVPNTERLKKLPDAEPDRFVKKAVSNALKAREEDKVAEQRRRLKPAERHNPQAVATEGLVERVCIPLVGAQQFVGMLDIKWKITHRQAGLLDVQHSSINLQHLGTRIGAVYLRHQLAKVNDRNKHAVQAVGAYLFQKAHRLNNAIQDLYSLAQEINDAKTEGDRQASIAELMAKVDEYTDTIKWAMDMGERVQDSSRKKLLVYDLVEESLEVIDRPCDREKKIHLKILDELAVTGSPQLLREIFVNLINNAFDAMEKVKEPSLTIRADHCNEKKDVEIIFEDNGVGMTKAEIKNAENGFVAKGDHTGNGVLISRVMAQVQGGSLSYESEKGVGTKAIVILPAG